jgi:hypothetical protein
MVITINQVTQPSKPDKGLVEVFVGVAVAVVGETVSTLDPG